MPEVTAHTPGTPSRAELSTTNKAGALAFYGSLFGWVDDPQQIGENRYYHMQKLNGLEAAAIYQQGEEEKNMSVPAHWITYITAEDVDAEKAGRTGGKVLNGPMDVFDAGRTAILTDSQGAFFSIVEGV